MDQQRIGIIVYMDLEDQSGIIVDENCQDISFKFNELLTEVNIDTNVSFDIDLGENGLNAIRIKAIS